MCAVETIVYVAYSIDDFYIRILTFHSFSLHSVCCKFPTLVVVLTCKTRRLTFHHITVKKFIISRYSSCLKFQVTSQGQLKMATNGENSSIFVNYYMEMNSNVRKRTF